MFQLILRQKLEKLIKKKLILSYRPRIIEQCNHLGGNGTLQPSNVPQSVPQTLFDFHHQIEYKFHIYIIPFNSMLSSMKNFKLTLYRYATLNLVYFITNGLVVETLFQFSFAKLFDSIKIHSIVVPLQLIRITISPPKKKPLVIDRYTVKIQQWLYFIRTKGTTNKCQSQLKNYRKFINLLKKIQNGKQQIFNHLPKCLNIE